MVKLLLTITAFSTLMATSWGLMPKTKFKKEAGSMEWKGAFCSVSSPSYRIVHTQEEWEKLWREIGKPAPPADLKGYFAVAVFAGTRNTGGYNLFFEKALESPSQITVRYRLKIPPKDAMAIQALTQPYAVRLYPATGKPIAVEALKP